MKTVEWSDIISVNNSKIDCQHKKLITLTNNLILNSEAKPNSLIVNESLSELLEYAKKHFCDEEKLLKEHNYPKLDEHKIQHDKFLHEIVMFTKDVIDNKATVTEEMIIFLVNWLKNHTAKYDQDYKNYI